MTLVDLSDVTDGQLIVAFLVFMSAMIWLIVLRNRS